jgi:hypothetical protein
VHHTLASESSGILVLVSSHLPKIRVGRTLIQSIITRSYSRRLVRVIVSTERSLRNELACSGCVEYAFASLELERSS